MDLIKIINTETIQEHADYFLNISIIFDNNFGNVLEPQTFGRVTTDGPNGIKVLISHVNGVFMFDGNMNHKVYAPLGSNGSLFCVPEIVLLGTYEHRGYRLIDVIINKRYIKMLAINTQTNEYRLFYHDEKRLTLSQTRNVPRILGDKEIIVGNGKYSVFTFDGESINGLQATLSGHYIETCRIVTDSICKPLPWNDGFWYVNREHQIVFYFHDETFGSNVFNIANKPKQVICACNGPEYTNSHYVGVKCENGEYQVLELLQKDKDYCNVIYRTTEQIYGITIWHKDSLYIIFKTKTVIKKISI